MNELNRGVIVLKPKKLFLDWVNSADKGGVLTLDEVSRDCTAYLTPEIEDDNDMRQFLEQDYLLLFEQELVEWNQDEDTWPEKRDFPTFLEWFDVFDQKPTGRSGIEIHHPLAWHFDDAARGNMAGKHSFFYHVCNGHFNVVYGEANVIDTFS